MRRFTLGIASGLIGLMVLGSATPTAQAGFVDVFDIAGTATFDAGLNLWLYEYTITATDSPNGLSHWWLELPEFKANSIEDPFGPDTGDPWDPEYPEFGEPVDAALITAQGVDLSVPGTDHLFGIKWDAPEDSDFKDGVLGGFSFYSSHGPSAPDAYTWFTKFGRDGYDHGRTIGPNGDVGEGPPIPEPGTAMLLSLGLIGLRARRKFPSQ